MLNSTPIIPKTDFGYAHILRVAIPIILGSAAQAIVNVTDSVLLGHYTADPNAFPASAIAVLFFVTFVFLGMGYGIGAQIIIARAKGEGDLARIPRVFYQSLYFLVLLALGLMAFTLLAGPFILRSFVDSDVIYNEAVNYLQWRSFGILFVFAGIAVRSLCIGTSNTKPLAFYIAVLAITNYFFNDALIFGKYGFTEMGMAGSALGTNIAEGISMLLFVLYIRFSKIYTDYNINHVSRFNRAEQKAIFKVSAPSMLQMSVSVGAWFAFFIITENMGKQALAISNLVRQIYMVMMVPLIGFTSATSAMVSELIGLGRSNEIFALLKRIIIMSVACTAIISLVNVLFPYFLPGLVVADTSLVQDTLLSSYVISGSILLFAVAYIMFSGVSGTGNTATSLLIETSSIGIYLIAAFIFARVLLWPIHLVWACEYVYFGVMLIMSFIYLRSGKWQGKKI
jgi:putative MATE family efflux protein